MVAITPIRSVATIYAEMDENDIGKLGSKGFGPDKFRQFIADIRELCRLAKIAEKAASVGHNR